MLSSLHKNSIYIFVLIASIGSIASSYIPAYGNPHRHPFFSRTSQSSHLLSPVTSARISQSTFATTCWMAESKDSDKIIDVTDADKEAPASSFDEDEDEDEDEEDELVELGELKLSEIKAELKMRSVDFSDCFDRDSMVAKLREARSTGKADPSILNEFNKINEMPDEKAPEITEKDIDGVLGNDGKLPGGMSPEMVQNLMKNPELMSLLQDPKMQECMTIMMTQGQEALEETMKKDPQVREKVLKLNELLSSAM